MSAVVVLVIDGWGAKHLGPLGNTWIESPALNQFASQSWLWQSTYGYPTLAQAYDALWGAPLADLSERWHTRLFADDVEVLDHRGSAVFGEQSRWDVRGTSTLAAHWEETLAAQFFAQVAMDMASLPDKTLSWYHFSGMRSSWDAPYEYRSHYADEEDAAPSRDAAVPSWGCTAGVDPDELHALRCAYAGQVSLVDQCLEGLLTVWQQTQDTLLLLLAPRAFPLGEHQVVGWDAPCLYGEMLHVPCMVGYPGGTRASQRDLGIRTLADVPVVLDGWLRGQVETLPPCPYLIRQQAEQVLLRTPLWQFHLGRQASELYVKPDDQHEVNNVADRCADLVEAAQAFVEQASAGAAALPSVLEQLPA